MTTAAAPIRGRAVNAGTIGGGMPLHPFPRQHAEEVFENSHP